MIRLKIAGVYKEMDSNDPYWQVSPENMGNECLMKRRTVPGILYR